MNDPQNPGNPPPANKPPEPPPNYHYREPKRGLSCASGCLWVAAIFVAIFVSLTIVLFVISYSVQSSYSTLNRSGSYDFVEKTIKENPNQRELLKQNLQGDRIAVINIRGIMLDNNQGGFSSSQVAAANSIIKEIKYIKEDPTVKAVVLRIDSPGGAVSSANMIYHYLMQLKATRKIPVVSCFGSVAASGGYYVAMASDYIVANKMTITGSIGVIMNTYKYYELLDKIGVKAVAYTSGKMKDMLSGTRPTNPEEAAIVENIVRTIYLDFVDIVNLGRPKLSLMQIKDTDLADGRVFLGSQAIRNGLIDKLGFFNDAVQKAAEMANLQEGNYSVYELQERFSLAKIFGAAEAAAEKTNNVNVNIGGNATPVLSMEPGKPYLLPTYLVK